jgi:hypothetical protein
LILAGMVERLALDEAGRIPPMNGDEFRRFVGE